MTTTKHTRGPWQCSTSPSGLLVSKKTGEPIAQFEVAPTTYDASLIAAAPELLVALNEQIRFLNVLAGTIPLTEKDTHRRVSIQIEELRAAIAKAIGV